MKKLYLLFIAAVISLGAMAQVTTSSISGTVTDEKGEPVIGATIIAVHTPSGTEYGTVADSKGNYRLLSIRPGGPYTVTVSLLGYQPVQYNDINVALADNYVINTWLKETSVDMEAVVVTAKGSSNMNSDRAGAVSSFNSKTIANAPTVSRSLNDITKMTPQANGTAIGGGDYRSSYITVDGAAFNNAFGIGQNMPANGSPISLDAIEQISVSITPYDVRQSGFTGASVNAVTRSGDNEFRGSVYTYLNNENFKGNDVGDVSFAKSKSKYNLYGVRFGGPIVKNKLFFFVNYENEKSVEPGPSRVAGGSTFDENGNPIYYSDGTDNVARPTVEQLEMIREKLLSMGYDPGAYQGYSSDSPGHKLLARIDWNINDNHKFNIRYSETKAKNPAPPSTSTSGLGDRAFTTNTRQAMTAIYFQNARYFTENNFKSWAGELNSRFADGRINNVLRVSYSHQNEPRSYDGSYFPFVDICQDGDILTSFGNELFSYGNLRDVKTWNITDEVSWNIDRHNFLAGFQYEHNTTKNGFQRFGAGYYQYNSIDDFLNDRANQFAITHSMKEDFSQAFPQFNFNQLSFYFQDEYAVSDRFKLTAGIRFELPMYPKLDSYNEQVADTWLSAGKYDYPNLMKKYDTRDMPATKLMVSPRVGFNWDLLGNRKLVLRGGTGLFTGRIPFVWIVSAAGDSGVIQTTYTAYHDKQGNVVGTIPSFSTDRNAILNQIYPNGLSDGVAPISAVSLMDKNLRMPQTWKTSLALDGKFGNGWFASVEGIYNSDINPVAVTNVAIKPGHYTDIKNEDGTPYGDNRMFYGEFYDSRLKNAYKLTNAERGGYYYSVTAKVEKSFNFGLSAMVAYTHSGGKAYTDGTGDQISGAWYNSANVNGSNSQELGFRSYVIPNRLIASVSYRKEYAKHFATSISLFYEGRNGGRFNYIYSSAILGDNGGNNLIYVPSSKDELSFQDYTYKSGDNTYTYSAEQQANDFWAYINQDSYLKTRKGRYAERGGAVYPWVSQFDLKIMQDFFVNVKGKRNTIQVGLDIENFANLLNKDWGHKRSYNRNTLLQLMNQSDVMNNNAKPVYRFLRNGTEVLDKTFSKTIGYSSTYSMQLSIRYIFN